jgi:methylmalonyl-CoA mutase cobalamin-binding subunit
MPALHDLTCVVHVHSTHSDGTGTVPEIARAAARSDVDVVLLTDHDTLAALRRGEEGWHGSVLVLVGEEVSPRGRDHFLAFGVERVVDRRQDSAGICASVAAAGGFGFAAHPFSQGSAVFKRPGAMPWTDIDCAGLEGMEVWSFVTDTAERLRSWREIAGFIARPEQTLDHAPERNLAEWDRLGARRRVVGIAGIDAHQIGLRVLGRVPVRLMSYARSFRHLRTHVLCEELPTGELEHDREQVYSALRSGRCYMAVDSLAPGRGFEFSADGVVMGGEVPAGAALTFRVRTPRPAALRLLRDGAEVAASPGAAELEHATDEPGVYRAEARLEAHGRERTWILSNPIYVR